MRDMKQGGADRPPSEAEATCPGSGAERCTGKVESKGRGGFTLIEVVTVLVILSILMIAMGFSFVGWRGRYRVESQVREVYTDVMQARARAMQRKMVHFINMPAAELDTYRIYEDTNPAPNGDGIFDASDTLVVNTTLLFDINADERQFTINKNGILSPNSVIRFDSDPGTDYDCVDLAPTRINMGLWNGTICEGK